MTGMLERIREEQEERQNEFSRNLSLHARALAAHCECLAMNAANMIAAIADLPAPHPSQDYYAIMEKWGLIDSDGTSTFI